MNEIYEKERNRTKLNEEKTKTNGEEFVPEVECNNVISVYFFVPLQTYTHGITCVHIKIHSCDVFFVRSIAHAQMTRNFVRSYLYHKSPQLLTSPVYILSILCMHSASRHALQQDEMQRSNK